MNIGYACLTLGVPDTDLKSCILKNATESRLMNLISHNLNSLENIINYNIANNIKLFRISSDLIPFGSSPVNNLPWWDIFKLQFKGIGNKIKSSKMRVSMHPGQYTVLNSPNEAVVNRAFEDLNYHVKVLDSLGVGAEHKIVLHIGGIYNDKKQAIKRFISNYGYLDEGVKQRLILENDDKSYNIFDVFEIAASIKVPVVYDNLHNQINSFDSKKDDLYWIKECKKTWQNRDGMQKIHYSQQGEKKRIGSHANSIRINEFTEFYEKLEDKSIEIMLEVKDKNLSAIKCINVISQKNDIKALENEWNKYKYKVLENSPEEYKNIKSILCNKGSYLALPFYNAIENALKNQSTVENSLYVAKKIWRDLEKSATEKEKINFSKQLKSCIKGDLSIQTVKNFLLKMADKYEYKSIRNSYYFIL